MRQLSALSGGTLRMGAQEILLKADLVLHFGIVMIEEVRVLLTDLTKAEHMVSHLEGAIHHHPADPDNPDLSSFLVEIVLLVAFRVKVEQALVVGQHILMQKQVSLEAAKGRVDILEQDRALQAADTDYVKPPHRFLPLGTKGPLRVEHRSKRKEYSTSARKKRSSRSKFSSKKRPKPNWQLFRNQLTSWRISAFQSWQRK